MVLDFLRASTPDCAKLGAGGLCRRCLREVLPAHLV
jgi:hypothetical protein